jgi:hypothetical protein
LSSARLRKKERRETLIKQLFNIEEKKGEKEFEEQLNFFLDKNSSPLD